MHDGYTWAKDRHGNPFTEETATEFRDMLNDERKPDKRTYIMAAVSPVMSPELLRARADTLARGGE